MSKTIGEVLDAVNSQTHGVVIVERTDTPDLITPDSVLRAARRYVDERAPYLTGTRYEMAIAETLGKPEFQESLKR